MIYPAARGDQTSTKVADTRRKQWGDSLLAGEFF
jgi:hypothetical protein